MKNFQDIALMDYGPDLYTRKRLIPTKEYVRGKKKSKLSKWFVSIFISDKLVPNKNKRTN